MIFSRGTQNEFWKQDSFKIEFSSHKRALDRMYSDEDGNHALRFLDLKVSGQYREPSSYAQLCAFIGILLLLDLHAEKGGLSAQKIEILLQQAEDILKRQGIRKKKPEASYYQQCLHLAVSRAYKKLNRHWLSHWHQQIAVTNRGLRVLGQTSTVDADRIENLLTHNKATEALETLDRLLESGLSLPNLILVKLLYVKAYHASGKHLQALAELKEIPQDERQLRLLS